MTTKHTPATPLPWVSARSQAHVDINDAAYLTHAANAYPFLVDALKGARAAYSLQATRDATDEKLRKGWNGLYKTADKLLRELGEL